MKTLVIVGVVAVCSVVASAQQETLPEIARRSAPNPVFQTRSRELVLTSVESAISGADTVIYGTVERASTYLSGDQKDLYTDYLIRPLRVMKPAQEGTPSSRPGQPQSPTPVTVTRWGGQMVIDGVPVTQDDHDIRAFRIGEQVILLLTSRGSNRFVLSSSTSSAFTVQNDKIRPVLTLAEHPVFDKVRGMNVSQFEIEVHRGAR